jgi:hypothetical protein
MTQMPTFFASAKRKSEFQIKEEARAIGSLNHIHDFLSALSQVILVLNQERQLVFANKVTLSQFGLDTADPLLGKRPGEALGCVNSSNNTGGCGTAKACQYCGAVGTILKSQDSERKEKGECRIIGADSDGKSFFYDLEVTASPLSHQGQQFTILTLVDISSKKRRNSLERTFFHDILNIAGSLSSIMDLMPNLDEEQKDDFMEMAGLLSRQVVDEIKTHQTLLHAENGDLAVNIEPLLSKDILTKALQQMYHHDVAKGKFIRMSLESVQQSFQSDGVLLNRVIVNMIKNALEATEKDGVVEIGCKLLGANALRFYVKNDTLIPEKVSAQIFQRSFSTKGSGRGIGTYSIKLFGEQYLNAKVGFVSNEKERTVFFIDFQF